MESEAQIHSASNEDLDSTLSPKKEEVVLSWNAPARPFKKRDKEFYTTVIAIAVLVGLILFFVEGPLPVAGVMAVVFLVYVLSTVPPEEVECKITNKGVFFADKKYPWDTMTRFWFASRFGANLLILETVNFPGRVEMVIKEEDRENIRQEIEKHVLFEKAA